MPAAEKVVTGRAKHWLGFLMVVAAMCVSLAVSCYSWSASRAGEMKETQRRSRVDPPPFLTKADIATARSADLTLLAIKGIVFDVTDEQSATCCWLLCTPLPCFALLHFA